LHVWRENAPFLAVFGVKIWENKNFLHYYPSRNAITQNRRHMMQTS